MNRNVALLISAATLFIISCNIDPEIDIIGDCDELDLNDGYEVYLDTIMYYAPYFNPNNADQFVYIERNNTDYIKRLYIYDMITLTKTYLCDDASFNPRWTKNDWIVFNRGGTIWKIKTSGDSLTLLFSGYVKYGLELNPRGDRIIFRESNDYYTTYLADINGVIIDSIEDQFFGEASWSPNGLKISSKLFKGPPYYIGGSFGYYDTTLTTFTDVFLTNSNDTDDRILDTEWLPDSKNILWLSGNEYKITNTETNNTSSFIEMCDTNFKMWPCYSADGTKIIWERNYKEAMNHNSELYWQTQIVITDADGNNERLILPN